MIEKRLTIKDIAEALNIHHSTVSRALRGDFRVKAETARAIVEYADSSGYTVNLNAVKLRNGVRNVIALIVPNVHHRFFSNIISYVTDLAKEKGYLVAVFQSNEKQSEEKIIITNIIQNQFAGVLASISAETTNGKQFERLRKYGIPLVFFDRVCEDLDVPKVVGEGREAVEEAIRLLLSKGYDKVVHLTGSQKINVFRERQIGYYQALSDVDYKKSIIIENSFTKETGCRIVKELLSSSTPPNAIICDSYNLALGLYIGLKSLGKTIPRDMAVISFGNDASAEVLTPRMTTIVQPEMEFAKFGFALLVQEMESGVSSSSVIRVPHTICQRDSV